MTVTVSGKPWLRHVQASPHGDCTVTRATGTAFTAKVASARPPPGAGVSTATVTVRATRTSCGSIVMCSVASSM
jgi:hypothetical protein